MKKKKRTDPGGMIKGEISRDNPDVEGKYDKRVFQGGNHRLKREMNEWEKHQEMMILRYSSERTSPKR